jgi:hypothetical protein
MPVAELGLLVRIPRGHGWLSLVSVLCWKVKLSVTGRSLAQSSLTDCGISLYVIYKPQEYGGARGGKEGKLQYVRMTRCLIKHRVNFTLISPQNIKCLQQTSVSACVFYTLDLKLREFALIIIFFFFFSFRVLADRWEYTFTVLQQQLEAAMIWHCNIK